MSNDDLRHTSDDAARTHSSDAWDDLSQLDTLVFPLSDRHVPGLSFTSATDNYVRPRLR